MRQRLCRYMTASHVFGPTKILVRKPLNSLVRLAAISKYCTFCLAAEAMPLQYLKLDSYILPPITYASHTHSKCMIFRGFMPVQFASQFMQ